MVGNIRASKCIAISSLVFFALCATAIAYAEDRVELDTTLIKGNKELPKILYVVPWKEIDGKAHEQQKLHLHSLFGDLFDPRLPLPPDTQVTAPESNN